MGPLRASLAAACLAFATPAHAEVVSDWRSYTDEASARFGVPVEWIEAVMQAESGGQTRLRGRPIRSSAGAMGLMQLIPGPWASMRARHGTGYDPNDTRNHIPADTSYPPRLSYMFTYPA